jgi:hypothetical protein
MLIRVHFPCGAAAHAVDAHNSLPPAPCPALRQAFVSEAGWGSVEIRLVMSSV